MASLFKFNVSVGANHNAPYLLPKLRLCTEVEIVIMIATISCVPSTMLWLCKHVQLMKTQLLINSLISLCESK